jgi:hypothetical protein
MASFEIAKTLSDGVYKYISNIIVDKPVYIINSQYVKPYKYLIKRIPQYLNYNVPKDLLQEVLDISFMLNCKYGSAKITIGRLLYYAYTLYGQRCNLEEKELHDIIDWFVIHEASVLQTDTDVRRMYEKENKLFHNCREIEHEFFDVNKRLRKTKTQTALEEIKLYYTVLPKAETYLDSNYIHTTRANAKFVTKGVSVPKEYSMYIEEIEDNYFDWGELRNAIELTAPAIVTTLLMDWMIECKFEVTEDSYMFYEIVTCYTIEDFRDYMKENTIRSLNEIPI